MDHVKHRRPRRMARRHKGRSYWLAHRSLPVRLTAVAGLLGLALVAPAQAVSSSASPGWKSNIPPTALSGAAVTAATNGPGYVTGVTAARASSTSSDVSWQQTLGASSYTVYKSTSPSYTWTTSKTIASGSTTTWTDPSSSTGDVYFVRAAFGLWMGPAPVDGSATGGGPAGGVATPGAMPTASSGFSCAFVGANIVCTWTHGTGLDRQVISKSIDGGATFTAAVTLDGTAETWTDTNPGSATPIYFLESISDHPAFDSGAPVNGSPSGGTRPAAGLHGTTCGGSITSQTCTWPTAGVPSTVRMYRSANDCTSWTIAKASMAGSNGTYTDSSAGIVKGSTWYYLMATTAPTDAAPTNGSCTGATKAYFTADDPGTVAAPIAPLHGLACAGTVPSRTCTWTSFSGAAQLYRSVSGGSYVSVTSVSGTTGTFTDTGNVITSAADAKNTWYYLKATADASPTTGSTNGATKATISVGDFDFTGELNATSSSNWGPWTYYNTSTWTKNNGYVTTTTAAASNPMAVVDAGKADFSESIGTRSAPGAAIYFRVTDASNWLRGRVNETSSTSWDGTYSFYVQTVYSCPVGGFSGGTAMTNGSYPTSQPYEQFGQSSINCDGGGTGTNTLYHYTVSNATTTYSYALILEKSVNGTITQLGTKSLGSMPAFIGVVAKGSSITVSSGSTAAGMTAGITATETFNQTATKHGFGYAASSYSGPSGITEFTLVDAP